MTHSHELQAKKVEQTKPNVLVNLIILVHFHYVDLRQQRWWPYNYP